MAESTQTPLNGLMEGESALIVPVPSAEPLVGLFRDQYDPAAPAGIPAHITILYPFKPPDAIDQSTIDELRDIFAGVPSFPFTLAAFDRFPDVVYLVPEPAEPFVRLTAAIATRWPDTPPYEGVFDQVIPHLTVAHAEDPTVVAELRRQIEPDLPLACRAEEAWLMGATGGRWAVEETFRFTDGDVR